MTPKLFESTETAFTSEGLGRLSDATKCEVAEERNGQYELVLEYPVGGQHFEDLQTGRYIWATHDDSKVPQAFQIYNISEPLQGKVMVNAWHISYALNSIVVKPFTAGSCAAAVAAIVTNSIGSNPFTFWTDKAVTADYNLTVPKTVRSMLGGSEGSLLDVYGKGEYEFDMFTVKLWLNRGTNNGVKIKYGKNLTKLDRELDASKVFNAVVPFWTNDETTVALDHAVVRTGQTQGRTVPLDLSGEWDEAPTTTQLENKAQSYIDNSTAYEVKENIKIDFVQLWQTEEYKDIANLERVKLCDTVTIDYAKRGITATAKVIKVVYDTLRERYISMELGEPKTTLGQQITEDTAAAILPRVPSKSVMQAAIDHATELITGGFGGYIKYNYLSDGTPSEMLIMDSPSEATATNIIRLNQNGIGFSTDGGATYASAWTIDGNFNADFITTGNLLASLITTGLLQDATGKNYWNLDTGQFVTLQGELGRFKITADGLNYDNGKAIIGPDGITYSDGSVWRVNLEQALLFQKFISGAWADAVKLQQIEDSVNGATGAMIEVDGVPVMYLRHSDNSGGRRNEIYGPLYLPQLLTADAGVKMGNETLTDTELDSMKNGSPNICTAQLSGTGSGSYTFGGYNAYLFVGYPSSASTALVSLVVPAKLAAGSNDWQISDEQHYYKFNITGGAMTGLAGNGIITAVYGIY